MYDLPSEVNGKTRRFPQVVSLVQHIEDKEEPAEGAEVCVSCHDPHNPSLVEGSS